MKHSRQNRIRDEHDNDGAAAAAALRARGGEGEERGGREVAGMSEGAHPSPHCTHRRATRQLSLWGQIRHSPARDGWRARESRHACTRPTRGGLASQSAEGRDGMVGRVCRKTPTFKSK